MLSFNCASISPPFITFIAFEDLSVDTENTHRYFAAGLPPTIVIEINVYHLLVLLQYYDQSKSRATMVFMQQITDCKVSVTSQEFLWGAWGGRRRVDSWIISPPKGLFVCAGICICKHTFTPETTYWSPFNCQGVDFYTVAKVMAVCFLSQVLTQN